MVPSMQLIIHYASFSSTHYCHKLRNAICELDAFKSEINKSSETQTEISRQSKQDFKHLLVLIYMKQILLYILQCEDGVSELGT